MEHGLTGSFQLMKTINKSLILNVIRTQGPISRAAIAKKTNLTPPTITNLVGELLESNFIVESELGSSSGGRKPILLRIQSEVFRVIGVDVGSSKLKIIATNLDGKVIDSLDIGLPKPLSREEFVSILKKGIKQMMTQAVTGDQSLIGIGIAMHGLVNPLKGTSIFAPNFGFRDIPIKDILEGELGVSVEVENDVRSMALGENWFGNGQGISVFICINVGMGIGAGFIFDHKLYQGTSFTAGEFGHTTIEPNGPLCSCGNRGCLQALSAGPAIVDRVLQELQVGRQSILEKEDVTQITAQDVYQAALKGDDLTREVLAATGRYLGIGIANIINTLNPMKVIVGGGVMDAGEFVWDSLIKTVQQRSLQTASQHVTIQKAKLGKYATAIGASTLVLRKLFTPDITGT